MLKLTTDRFTRMATPTTPGDHGILPYNTELHCLMPFVEIDPTLKDVCSELGDVTHKWFKIGIQLGIPRNLLKQFANETDPLSAAVDYWLKGNAKESAVPVAWKSIVEVLKSKYVGEPALAEEVSKKYCQLVEKGQAP